MRHTRRVAIGLVALLAVAPASAQRDDRDVLAGILSDFAAAFNAKDAAALSALYADDAVLMAPGALPLRGRSAIDGALAAMVSRGGALRFDPPFETEVVGDRAFVAGTYTLTVSGANSPAQVFAAKYLTVFRRVGNGWKVAYDMQNASAPAK